jgi:K+ transporter
VRFPEILSAVDSRHAVEFFARSGPKKFLVVTGEALHADMGHFGLRPIGWSWWYCPLCASTPSVRALSCCGKASRSAIRSTT